jgi:penicillin-binding protein 1C
VDAATGQRLSAECRDTHRERELDLARWPALAQPWLRADLRRRAQLPALAADCRDDGLGASEPLRIDGVADGATLRRAPGSARPPELALRALGAQARVLWLVNGKLEGETEAAHPFKHAFEEAGPQTVTALGSAGNYAQVAFRVLR